jgi:hypothetical protein
MHDWLRGGSETTNSNPHFARLMIALAKAEAEGTKAAA